MCITRDGLVWLGIESILVKYRDEILKPPLRLSAHITEGRVKILETNLKSEEIANLISKLNFYKLIPYPMDNLLNRSAQTGPPNVRKRRPVFPPAGRSVVLCTPQMAPRTSFLSRQPDVIASFSLSKPLRPLVS